MKFTIDKDKFLESLNQCIGGITGKSTIPILSSFLVKFDSDKISISATDLEYAVTKFIKFDIDVIEGEGDFVVNARKLIESVKSLPNGSKLDFQIETGKVNIKNDKSKTLYTINTISSEDFPTIPDKVIGIEFKIELDNLKDSIRKTTYAMSTEQARYFLNGIHFVFDDKLRLEATDGKRLSLINNIDIDCKEEFQVIVPSKFLYELLKVTGKEINVIVGNSQIQIYNNEFKIVSNLLDGSYPNVIKVIPESQENSFNCQSELFTKTINRIKGLADPKNNLIKIDIKKGSVLLTTVNTDYGIATDEFEIDYSGEEITLGCNYLYLLDALNNYDETEIEFGFSTSTNAITVKGKDNFNQLAIVMPIKLKEV